MDDNNSINSDLDRFLNMHSGRDFRQHSGSDPSAIIKREEWWISHFDFLKEHGYLMRPRYRPGWKPSYDPTILGGLWAEDGQVLAHRFIMDALRISDSLVVAMKRVNNSSSEEQIATFFSDDAHKSDPRNHCVRIIDIIPVPEEEEIILVMTWMRQVMDPRFRTVGEGIQFLSAMVEVLCSTYSTEGNEYSSCSLKGLQYMHQNNVAHRDCALNNMAMDASAMYTRPYHPVKQKKRYDWSGRALHHSRTRRPPRYYIIDFGQSRMYDPSQPRPVEYALRSGGYTPPEGLEGVPCDPFATDVFILGNLIRTSVLDGDDDRFLRRISGFECLRPLVKDMVVDDPSQRPTMDEVASRFSEIVQKIPWWKLRARAVRSNEFPLAKPFRALYHTLWTASMLLLLKPAIPSPKPVH